MNNLIESIEKARNTTLERALVSLGIPNIGKKTAKLIAREILHEQQNKGYDILHTLFSLTEENLIPIKDI